MSILVFQPNVCNKCHDLLMMSVNLSDIAILIIKGSDYPCIISLISKNEAINLLQNVDLTEKIFKSYIKIEKTITKFGDMEIKKQKNQERKRPILIKNIDVNKIVVSNKVSLGKKRKDDKRWWAIRKI